MEIDCKATEIEHLQMKLNETASLSSADNDNDNESPETIFEGWLSIPTKQNIRRHGWKRQYVVVSSRRIIFYNSDVDKQNTSDPLLIIDLRCVFGLNFYVRLMKGDIPTFLECFRLQQSVSCTTGHARRCDSS